ncbi:MAG: hypothetical protein MUE67_09005 [Anaerolineales bacterium]|nr:hypothetical protein [Anaerolineales bacterium]
MSSFLGIIRRAANHRTPQVQAAFHGVACGVTVSLVGGSVGVSVTVGGRVSVGGGWVSVGILCTVGVTVLVRVGVGVEVGEGSTVGVQLGKPGVGGVAVTKIGVKEGCTAVAAAEVKVAACAHKGVLVGRCSVRRAPDIRTKPHPVQ